MIKIKIKIAIVALMFCTVFSFGGSPTPMTFKDSAKAEVQSYVDVIKPLVEQITNSNKIAGLPENVVYGILSLIAVAIIMYFHRRSLAAQNKAHVTALKAQNDIHANTIKDIINDKA